MLIYEQCSCIHEMLKEIDYWLKMSSGSGQGSYGSMLQVAYKGASSDSTSLRKARTNDLLDFDQKNNDSPEDQIHMSQQIHQNQIDYLKTFQVVCSKLVNLFHSFNAPMLVWKMVNYLSFILEKNTENADKLISCLRQLNINKLLQLNSAQVHDALIDMLKNLLAHQPNSPIILEMCINLLDHCLTKTQHLDDAIKFWVFTMRVTSIDNPSKL